MAPLIYHLDGTSRPDLIFTKLFAWVIKFLIHVISIFSNVLMAVVPGEFCKEAPQKYGSEVPKAYLGLCCKNDYIRWARCAGYTVYRDHALWDTRNFSFPIFPTHKENK